jgi:hypothetical protein
MGCVMCEGTTARTRSGLAVEALRRELDRRDPEVMTSAIRRMEERAVDRDESGLVVSDSSSGAAHAVASGLSR